MLYLKKIILSYFISDISHFIDGKFNPYFSETDNQISQAAVNLKYQEVRSPATGTVFEMKAGGPGSVVNGNNSNSPLLKIVPDNNLVAKVFITNKDIGFIKEGIHP